MLYPSSIGPITPVASWSVRRIVQGYQGNISVVFNDQGSQSYIGQLNEKMDTVSLDAHLNGGEGRVAWMYDQIGGHHAQQQTPFNLMPRIGSMEMGGNRIVYMGGGSNPTGSEPNHWVIPQTIQSQNISPMDFTIIAVVRPTTSVARTQDQPLVETDQVLFQLNGAGGFVIRLVQRGTFGQEGWWIETPDNTLGPLSVEIGPCVICASSGPNGTQLRVNDRVISSVGRSLIASTAIWGAIGAPPGTSPGLLTKAWDGVVQSVSLYDSQIWGDQLDEVLRATRIMFNVATVPTIVVVGDSIAAGFNAGVRQGVFEMVRDVLPNNYRWHGCAVPGQAITPPPGSQQYGYTQGMFQNTVGPLLAKTPGKSIVIIWGGGNDAVIQPNPPSPQDVYDGILDLVQQSKGCKADEVIVCSILPRNDGHQNFRDALNLLLVGNGGLDFILCDFTTIAPLVATPLDPSLYDDGTHLTTLGFVLEIPLVVNTIQQALTV